MAALERFGKNLVFSETPARLRYPSIAFYSASQSTRLFRLIVPNPKPVAGSPDSGQPDPCLAPESLALKGRGSRYELFFLTAESASRATMMLRTAIPIIRELRVEAQRF